MFRLTGWFPFHVFGLLRLDVLCIMYKKCTVYSEYEIQMKCTVYSVYEMYMECTMYSVYGINME